MPYVGFLRRLVAYLVDGILLFVLFAVIAAATGGAMVGGAAGLGGKGQADLVYHLTSTGNLVSIVVTWLYFALLEASPLQATLGKMLLGCKVVDENGDQIGFGRATGRHFAKILSGMILLIGYLMIIFTERKQGLHDILAGTFVVRRSADAVVNPGTAYRPLQPPLGDGPLRGAGRYR